MSERDPGNQQESTTESDQSPPPVERRNYVTRHEAGPRLINTTIELLRTMTFPEVTTRRIAEAAELNLLAIQRIFGSQTGLFVAVAQTLAHNTGERLLREDAPDAIMAVFADPDVVLRTRLVAWLVGNGTDPKVFRTDPESAQLPMILRKRIESHGLGENSPVAARVYSEILTVATEGFITFAETHDFTAGDYEKAAQLLTLLADRLPGLAGELGWEN